MYAQANVTTPAQAAEACERIGFPVMIKASEGGGGKGIRMVRSRDIAGCCPCWWWCWWTGVFNSLGRNGLIDPRSSRFLRCSRADLSQEFRI